MRQVHPIVKEKLEGVARHAGEIADKARALASAPPDTTAEVIHARAVALDSEIRGPLSEESYSAQRHALKGTQITPPTPTE